LRMNLNTWVSFGLRRYSPASVWRDVLRSTGHQKRGSEQEQSLADRQVAGPKLFDGSTPGGP
jgi:hypothetical protein